MEKKIELQTDSELPSKPQCVPMKILVLGATGLLGNTIFRALSQSGDYEVSGTTRNLDVDKYFTPRLASRLIVVKDLADVMQLTNILEQVKPAVVINCVALSRTEQQKPSRLIALFSLLPHRLHHLCVERSIRLIQIGSDGVFNGKRGGYTEADMPDAEDPYGVAKILGEVDGPGALTLRTSMVGPELASQGGLLSWFLRQENECRCYTRSIFSGLPTVVLARIVHDIVLPNDALQGVYHVAAAPISKYDLLSLIRHQYGKKIEMIPDESVVIDRSLSAERFRFVTGYEPPSWEDMVETMHAFKFGLRTN